MPGRQRLPDLDKLVELLRERPAIEEVGRWISFRLVGFGPLFLTEQLLFEVVVGELLPLDELAIEVLSHVIAAVAAPLLILLLVESSLLLCFALRDFVLGIRITLLLLSPLGTLLFLSFLRKS